MTPYSMATVDSFFAKTNKAQGVKYLTKLPNMHSSLEGNASVHKNDVSPAIKSVSNGIFGTLSAEAAGKNADSYVDRVH